MLIQNKTNENIIFDKFISDNKHTFTINKTNNDFEISIIILDKSNLKGVLVFKNFVIIILNYLQIHTGSSIFELPINNKIYKSEITSLTRNLPEPYNLMYSACYLKVTLKL